MRPSLIRVQDIFPIWFSLILGLAAIFVPILSHLNADSWGGKVPLSGWIVSVIVSMNFIYFFIMFYYQRWKWISKWKYTTKHGIQCFFDDNTIPYLMTDVEDATVEVYSKLSAFASIYCSLSGVVCLFVSPSIFRVSTPGYLARLVYGAASGNFIKVGQGGKSIENTAYVHECGHIYINRSQKREVPENEAHNIFKKAGI